MSDTTSPTVAVVVLNWNGLNHLKTYLPSVLATTPAWAEVWVADNGSTDGSLEWVRDSHGSRVRTLALGENFGFAEGYNRALTQVNADVFVLLNSDVRTDGPWLEPVLAVMEREGWDVASPRMVQDVNPSVCEHAGAAGGWMDVDGYPFCLGRLFDSVEEVDGWHRMDREVFWASGACFFIRKAAWVAAGGFDGSLFAHMEEIDLCWRLKNRGYRIGVCGSSVVYHLGGGTLQKISPFKSYLNFRNNLYLLVKNHHRKPLYPMLLRRMVLDGIAAIKFLSEGSTPLFGAVWKAHRDFRVQFKTMKKKRQLELKSIRSATGAGPCKPLNYAGWYQGSILLAYFLRRKHVFEELSSRHFLKSTLK